MAVSRSGTTHTLKKLHGTAPLTRIWEDKATEHRALLGATLPPHRHVRDELIFLLEGANVDESGVVATGHMNHRPNGCVHTLTTQNGATVLAVVWGRTEPV